ncbi:transcriptional repressor [Campylobacter sputorum subsp. sputorum]|nr:transcriptional repressor [Campylobacter sputorum subsp. sputorum]
MMGNEAVFNNFLNIILSKKAKNSIPRKEILKILFYNKHISINEIQKIYKNTHKKQVSISTIYNTLNLLKKYNLLTIIKSKNSTKYEMNIHLNHDHLICKKCGKIIEFKDEVLQNLQKGISKKYDFIIQGHILSLEGICDKCKK